MAPQEIRDSILEESLTHDEIRISLAEHLLKPLKPEDAEFVEAALVLFSVVGEPENYINILCKLILDENHMSHEDVARALQLKANPYAINCLFDASQKKFKYLDFDEENAFARKCLWALGDINTKEAWEKIQILSLNSDPSISKWAEEQKKRNKN